MDNTPLKGVLTGIVANCIVSGITYRQFVEAGRKEFIVQVLVRNNINQCKAARELEMHRNTLSRTIRELKIDLASLRTPKKQVQRAVGTKYGRTLHG